MIKNMFLPERVRGYYLFSVRIIGFDIGKTSVKATLILCKGRETIVEKCFEAPIQSSSPADYSERASAAIKIILDQIPHYDRIVSSLSSAQAIFKELKLPFIGTETIKKVIAYEVEPLLPFALSDAVIDCMVTKEIPEENSSIVLVAAVQNQYIASHLALFEAAGVQPDQVVIDLFALYGLYSMIPAYAQQKGGIVLLETETQSTRMAYIYDGQLRFIRTLSKGLLDQARLVATDLNISESEALEHIVRFGLETDHDQNYANATKKAFSSFFNDILFTLQSFVSQAKPAQSIHKIIIFGAAAAIKGLPELITDLSHIKTELFSVNSLIHNGFGISAKSTIPQANMVSFATALPQSKIEKFDLRQKEFALSRGKSFMKEFVLACGLLALILGGLLFNTIWQTRRLKKEAYQSEQEIVETLKENIKNIPESADTLDEALSAAQNRVKQEEQTWSSFSSSARTKFLQYLLELTDKINKDALGLDVEKLTITPDLITLKGQVPDYPQLRALEASLRESKILKPVTVHTPKFNMLIHINKSGKGSAS